MLQTSVTSATLATPLEIIWGNPKRAVLFHAWLAALAPKHNLQTNTLRAASADASFRRYFRIDSTTNSFIIMDAPPDKEDSAPFVRIARLLGDAGLLVPRILDW
jgi:aminoglycoside/choline kinase family phosphotransferase